MRWFYPALHYLLLAARKLCDVHCDNTVLTSDLENNPISH